VNAVSTCGLAAATLKGSGLSLGGYMMVGLRASHCCPRPLFLQRVDVSFVGLGSETSRPALCVSDGDSRMGVLSLVGWQSQPPILTSTTVRLTS